MIDPAAILGPSGSIARRMQGYEHRPQQLAMAQAVSGAIAGSHHLMVEAGTGVGKSFAYLVPAILAAAGAFPTHGDGTSPPSEGGERGGTGVRDGRGNPTPHDAQPAPAADRSRSPSPASKARSNDDEPGPSRRVVISTHTISLQEQLIHKDIPFLNAVMPVEFSAVLVKGRSNYLSLRRMQGAIQRAGAMFLQDEELNQLRRIGQWTRQTHDGSLSDLSFRPLPQVWDEVQSEHGNCLGRKCPTYSKCFYFQARRRVHNAHLLVVNHALFFSDLALRRQGASILPNYDIVILDEAHTLEEVASTALGLEISNTQIEYLLNKLYHDRTNRGLLVHYRLGREQQLVQEVRFAADDFFQRVAAWLETAGSGNGRVRRPNPVPNTLAEPLKRLAHAVSQAGEDVDTDEERQEFIAASDRCHLLAGQVDDWLAHNLPEAVYWVERAGRRRQRLTLACAPIDVGPGLREALYNKIPTVILTSATLAVGSENSFEFLKRRLGLTQCQTLKLGSPFDYRRQARLCLPHDMPDPAEQHAPFVEAASRMIQRYVAATQGRAFVLFTSYEMMREVAARLTAWLAQENYALYSQAEGLPRSQMLERFRSTPRAVLFGTDSFWQGVDVPGEALSNVIITKLPFRFPSHPLLQARLEAIRRGGGNPFRDYQLPEAVLKLKQGFGRLIRTRNDTGMVAILDPRILTKSYGRVFLDSLPECERVVESCRGGD